MPVLLPTAGVLPGEAREQLKLQGPSSKQSARKPKTQIQKNQTIAMGGLRFAPPADPTQAVEAKAPRVKAPKLKNDPQHVAAARELRDRYLEQFNSGLLLGEGTQGKYAVGRAIEASSIRVKPKQLPQAA
jgi:hypothetical protein